jgi:hypothetical protein
LKDTLFTKSHTKILVCATASNVYVIANVKK